MQPDTKPVEVGWMLRAMLGRVLSLVADPTIVLSFGRPGFLLHSLSFDPNDLAVDLSSQRCLITGANQGIGFETARALAGLGAEVVLLCRDRQRGLDAAARIATEHKYARVDVVALDMSDLRSVRAVAPGLRERKIDVLVHNAGLLPSERVVTADGIEQTMATHVVGPHLLTGLLHPAYTDNARVVWVSSGGMYSNKLSLDDWNWEKRPYDGVAAYAQTKRMQVVLSELWAQRLPGIRVNCMHPGWADTSGVGTSIPRFHRLMKSVLRTPAEGADTIVWLAASPAAQNLSGLFFLDRAPRTPYYMPFTRETAADRQALWGLCERLIDAPPAA